MTAKNKNAGIDSPPDATKTVMNPKITNTKPTMAKNPRTSTIFLTIFRVLCGAFGELATTGKERHQANPFQVLFLPI